MKRGEIYRVAKPPGNDPKQYRYFVVVSRDALITSKFSTVICAPTYTIWQVLANPLNYTEINYN